MDCETALRYLKTSLAAGRLAQAYVLAAPPASTGAQTAVDVLQLLFCRQQGEGCGMCPSCRQVAERTHADVLWVEPQKKSRLISVDQVRDLQRRVQQTSLLGGWKACVLVGADRLGMEASNAFLKTLEEPPAKTVFLLLTDSPQFLLPTISSRCQSVAISTPLGAGGEAWEQEIEELLAESAEQEMQVGDVPAALAGFARSGRLLAVLGTLKKAAEAEVAQAADEASTDETDQTLDARAGARYREMRGRLMALLLIWQRDLLLLVCGSDGSGVFFQNRMETLRRKAAELSYRKALRNVRTVEKMNRLLERNLPETLVFTGGLGRLA